MSAAKEITKDKSLVGETRETVVSTRLHHWSGTCVSYQEGDKEGGPLHAYPIMDLFPELDQYAEGIKLKVTVEVLDEGTPCPVRRWRDGETCTCKRHKD